MGLTLLPVETWLAPHLAAKGLLTEGPQRQVARVVILGDDGRVVLYDPVGAPYVTLPGGGVEEGETPEMAAIREVREETGLVVMIERHLLNLADDQTWRTYYLAREVGGKVTARDADGGRRVRVRRVPLAEAYDLVTSPLDKQALRAVPVTLKYRPDQPRDPKGTPTGGRWTSAHAQPRVAALTDHVVPMTPGTAPNSTFQALLDEARRDEHPRPVTGNYTEAEEQHYRQLRYAELAAKRAAGKSWLHPPKGERMGLAVWMDEHFPSTSDERRDWDQQNRYDRWKMEVGNYEPPAPPTGHSVSDYLAVDDDHLHWDGLTVTVDGQEVVVGRGTGYSPYGGGRYIMMDGKVTIGPTAWLGRNAEDIPELKRAIEAREAVLVAGITRGGDFSKVAPTEYNDTIARILYAYKTPLATNPDPVNRLAEAYIRHGQVHGGEKEHSVAAQFDRSTEKLRAELAEYETKFPEHVDWLRREIAEMPRRRIQAIISNVGWLEHVTNMYSQEAVDQFAAEVSRTQADLAQRYPQQKTLTLHRGVQAEYADAIKDGVRQAGVVTINTNPVSSWTSDVAEARKFAGSNGVVLTVDVPMTDILFTHFTSPYIRTSDFMFGGHEEHEFLVANPTGTLTLGRDNVA